ncbi:MAG: hypothetical protein N2171_07770 [Clostridia bacterium]|nr:hypothetical protein [Clostridia bacterium]
MDRFEFSKVLALVISILFVCTVCFVSLVWAVSDKMPEQLRIGIDILGVVSTPFGIIVTGYFAKSGVENYTKIKGSKKDENNLK